MPKEQFSQGTKCPREKILPEVIGIISMNSFCEMLWTGFRQLWFFIEETKNSLSFGLNQVNTILIVNKGNFLDTQAFLFIQILFIFEDPLIEKLLQFFVTIINTELFKTVDSKVFETRDVQDTNVIRGFLKREKDFSANVLLGHIDDLIGQVKKFG